MNQPDLYKRVNIWQRHDAKKIVDEFAGVLKLRSDGRDSLIDIGCGSGDVLMDFIFPILPDTYTKVIGTDISEEMIQYSKKTYAQYDRVDFKVLDIENDRIPLEFHKQFDHVTSFYCLHWTQNQRQAFKNIYNMVCKDGDCLIAFPATCTIFEVYAMLSMDPKWKEYMKDLDKFIPSSQNDPDIWKTYTKLLKEVGFNDHRVEIREGAFPYKGRKSFNDHWMAVNPFIGRMPRSKQQEYLADICKIFNDMGLCEKMPHNDDCTYFLRSKLVIIYARK